MKTTLSGCRDEKMTPPPRNLKNLFGSNVIQKTHSGSFPFPLTHSPTSRCTHLYITDDKIHLLFEITWSLEIRSGQCHCKHCNFTSVTVETKPVTKELT